MEMGQRSDRGTKSVEQQKFSTLMQEGYEEFTLMSTALTGNIKGIPQEQSQVAFNEVLDVVLDIQKQYFEDMEANYRLTGNSTTPQMQDDLALCSSLLTELHSKF